MAMLAFSGFNEKPNPDEIPYLGCYIRVLISWGKLSYNLTLH